jgi:hypothetical protein
VCTSRSLSLRGFLYDPKYDVPGSGAVVFLEDTSKETEQWREYVNKHLSEVDYGRSGHDLQWHAGSSVKAGGTGTMRGPESQQPSRSKVDVFICHASEDKESFARRLAEELVKHGLSVWYDEFSLKLGDSLRRSIDTGLTSARYGIVVLSKVFFEKNWPQYELDGLVGRETSSGEKVILPIWHGVSKCDVEAYSPSLAGRVAVSSDLPFDQLIAKILEVVRPGIP